MATLDVATCLSGEAREEPKEEEYVGKCACCLCIDSTDNCDLCSQKIVFYKIRYKFPVKVGQLNDFVQ